MRAGTYDRRITIQKPVTVTDSEFGPQDGGWQVVAARVPAQVWDNLPGSSETNNGDLRVADRPARVRIRYVRGLSSDMRVIVHDETDRVCQIVGGPAEIGRREAIEMTIQTFTS